MLRNAWLPFFGFLTLNGFQTHLFINEKIHYDAVIEGGKGGSRSRFTENKTVLSQFTKNKIGISRLTEKNENVFTVTF